MTLHILGGILNPVTHDGTSVDAVYGVDAAGAYIGVVPASQAASLASRPPPQMGEWRWRGGAWTRFHSVEDQGRSIEAQRDATISAGVTWSGRTWYADQVFQQQLAAYLQAFALGMVLPGATVGIRSKDKTVYQLGQADLMALAGTVMQFVQQAYSTSWAAKAAIGS